MSARRSITPYKLTDLDKSRFVQAAIRYLPFMSLTAIHKLVLLKHYTVREGDLILFKSPEARPSLRQFYAYVSQFLSKPARPRPGRRFARRSIRDTAECPVVARSLPQDAEMDAIIRETLASARTRTAVPFCPRLQDLFESVRISTSEGYERL